jgi:photosystem II stability/assembly factor-like uncharacterized protein
MWRLNRRRARWFLAGLALAGLYSLWFCWLQPPGPVGPPREGWFSLRGWWRPVERNAHRRLLLVPSVDLNGCFFTNHLGWVVGDNGVILHTRDAGRSWQAQTNIAWGEMPDARMTRANLSQSVAAQTSGSKEGKTDDGKASQVPIRNSNLAGTKEVPPDIEQGPPATPAARAADYDQTRSIKDAPPAAGSPRPRPPQHLNGVWFVDDRRGWAAGALGTILHTTDGGQNWAAQAVPTAESLSALTFVDSRNGWVVGSGGTVLRTEDGGQVWTTHSTQSSGWLNAVAFVDAQRGWAAGGGAVLHTTDGGLSWTNQTIRGGPRLLSVAFVNADQGWAVGSEGSILHTATGGRTWEAYGADDPPFSGWGLPFNAVCFVDSRHGWVAGDLGTILHTDDGGQTRRQQRSNTQDPLRYGQLRFSG